MFVDLRWTDSKIIIRGESSTPISVILALISGFCFPTWLNNTEKINDSDHFSSLKGMYVFNVLLFIAGNHESFCLSP